MKANIYQSLAILKIGNHIIEEVDKQMRKHKFTYKDFQELQKTYEKLIYDFCIESYNKGKNDLPDKDFKRWLGEISTYEENKK